MSQGAGPLGVLLRRMVADEGPLTLERYMALALGHPTLGYYMTRDPFGRAGDFITAPEISQMFGELLGLWAAIVWQQAGAPDPLRLVELGPGRGTLMADALRAARSLPPFHAALDVHLVETSPVLQAIQRRTLADCGRPAQWHRQVETLPPGPGIVLANEFFDALPVRHYVRTAAGWCERCVGLEGGRLAFGLKADPEPALTVAAPEGSLLELGLAQRQVASILARRVAERGGAVLAIDYGYDEPGFGETLQAIKGHARVDPLAAPGEADLTAHVDFAALARAARGAGAQVWGPVSQRAFLLALGLEARAARLKAQAGPAAAAAVTAAFERLVAVGTAENPGMGRLFKVLAFTPPNAPPPPGFADVAEGAA